MSKGALFLSPALETVYRVLGLCDRDAASKTFGCCDRAHWHYKTADIANARTQEAGLLLALAYSTPAPNNPFHLNAAVRGWAIGIWRYWLSRRNGDGSVCEVYPFERSFCATSFSAAAFIESVCLLGGKDAWRDEVGQAKTTMDFLAANASLDVGNQVAASYLALRAYATLTDSATDHGIADKRLSDLLSVQWDDGTFPEYGGLDVGYQTITLGVLARALEYKHAPELQSSLEKGENAIRARINEDGRHKPEANSRLTQFVYPYAFAALNSPVLGRIENGLNKNVILRPTWMDDRYCIAMAIDYFWAYREMNRADDSH